MSPCSFLHFSILHVSLFLCLHISISPCFHVSNFMSPCLHFHVSTYQGFRKRKTELTENDNFRLFPANTNRNCKLPFVFGKPKRKRTFVFLGLQTKNRIKRLLFHQTCLFMPIYTAEQSNPDFSFFCLTLWLTASLGESWHSLQFASNSVWIGKYWPMIK